VADPAEGAPVRKRIKITGKGGEQRTIDVDPSTLNDPHALQAEAERQLGTDFVSNLEPPDPDAARNEKFFGAPGVVTTDQPGGPASTTKDVQEWMRSPTGQWVKTGLGGVGASVGGTLAAPTAVVTGPLGPMAGSYAGQQGVEDVWDVLAGQPLSGKQHLINAALTPVGELATAGLQAGIRGGRRLLFGAADEAAEAAARAATKYGVEVTPSQLNPQSGGAAAIDYIGQRIPGSRGQYAAVYDRQGDQIEHAFHQSLEESLPEAYKGPVTVETAGAGIRGRGVGEDVVSHEAESGAFRVRSRIAKQGADRYVKAGSMGDAAGLAVPGNANPLYFHAKQELADLEARGLETIEDQRLAQVYREIVDRGKSTERVGKIIDPTTGKPQTETIPPADIPFSQLLTWKMQLAPYLPRFEAAGAARGAGGREHLYGFMDRTISALAGQDQGTAMALRDANVFYRQTVAPVRELSMRVGGRDVAPGEALTRLIQDPDQARSVLYLRQLSDPERQMAAAGWWEHQLNRAGQTATGQVRRDYLLRQWRGLSPEMQDIVSGGDASAMHDVLHLMTQVSRQANVVRRSSGTPEAASLLAAGAGIGQQLATGNIKGALAIMGATTAPNLVARFITRPGVARALAVGSKVPLARATRMGGYLATRWQEVQDEASQGLEGLEQGLTGGEGETAAPEGPPEGPTPQGGLFQGPPAPPATRGPARRRELFAP